MSKQQQQNQLRELQKPLWTKLNQLRSFFKSIHVCVQVQKVTQIPETKQIELTLADNTGLARAILSEGAVDPNLIKVGNKIALRNAKTKYIDNKLVIIINKWGCITDENNSGLFEGQALELNNEQLNISEKKYDFKNIEIGKISPNEQVYNVLVKVIERKSVPLIQNNRKEEGGENLHQDKANLHVKLADKTGIINAIFPDLPKFRGLFEPNQNLQLVKAYVLQSKKGNNKQDQSEDFSIHLTIFKNKNSRNSNQRLDNSKPNGRIIVIPQNEVEDLLPNGFDYQSQKNISDKVWVKQQQQQN